MKISIRFPNGSLESLLSIFIFIAILLKRLNLSSRELWYDEVLSLLLSTGRKTHTKRWMMRPSR